MKLPISLLPLLISSNLFAQSLVIQTANGKVEGFANADKSVRIFRGIPFATPPVGDLRWKAPQPPKNWSGVLIMYRIFSKPDSE